MADTKPESRSITAVLSSWAQHQVPSLYIRSGPSLCVCLSVLLAVLAPALFIPLACWATLEMAWFVYFHARLVPQLTSFRPEDSGKPILQCDLDRIIDNVVFLIGRDSVLFWSRVTGEPSAGQVSLSTAKCFIKSLLFQFEECACYSQEEQVKLYQHALSRVELASGGFSEHPSHSGHSDHRPSLIRSWVDDKHLGSLVRCTPLAMVALSLLLRTATVSVIWICGFRLGHHDDSSGLECWVYNRQASGDQRPLAMFPGAGFGLTSFLPLALLYQWRYADRTILLYRLPWVEVCRPWSVLPQWSAIVAGIFSGLAAVELESAAFDVVSHSYGTAVANRFLRELCKPRPPDRAPFPRIHSLSLLDPIVLGGATTGLSGFIINKVGPDLSFAFCGNRAGNSSKEVLDFDPREYGQCLGGLTVYMSADDLLVDVPLAKYILQRHVTSDSVVHCDTTTEGCSFIRFCVDSTPNSFHGRWLVEIWCMGLLWGSPCAARCLSALDAQLGGRKIEN